MIDVRISTMVVLVMEVETICVIMMGLFRTFVGFEVGQKLFQQLMIFFWNVLHFLDFAR